MTHLHDQILPEGTQIGVYEIKGASKIGTFDITYRAWNHHLKEWVKIQEYFPRDFAIRANDGLGVEPKSPGDKEIFEYGLKAFLHQAEALTQIEHPNIAAAENILPFNGTAYLIMAAQEGMPLARLVQSQAAFAETELKFILVSILNALQKVHESKIVHGGIQPAAILLGKDGEPLLTGFAAARWAIAAHINKLTGEFAAGYAPVEQYEPASEPGPAADFYALGATLYVCMTHHQPVAAQSRIMALNRGESDPMALLSGYPDTPYSAELLQAVQWMLRPEYNDRPQSAGEILALLKSGHVSDQAGSLTSRQAATEVANSSPAVKNTLWIGVMAGIVALVTVGLWFDEKPVEKPDDGQAAVTSQPLFQRNPGKTAVTPETKEEQSVALAIDPSSQASGSNTISGTTQETMDEAEKQPKQQNLPGKPIDAGLVKRHLAAAEKAMKAGRLTTPLKDNAYSYYRMILAMEPDNAEALAGLQKIVDRYVQFIGKARTEGRFNDATLYLQRAESVLPDDPELQSIRTELAAAKE